MAYDTFKSDGLSFLFGQEDEFGGMSQTQASSPPSPVSAPVPSSAPPQSTSETQTPNASSVSASPVDIIPVRQVTVPTYDTLVEAARLIQQANNVDVMRDYISLEQSRRNLLLRKQNAKLETELKEMEAKYYEASARIDHIQEHGMTTPTSFGGMNPQTDNKKTIRLLSLKKLKNNYVMTLKINDIFYSSVKVGQTAGDYFIKSINPKLNCVNLNNLKNRDDLMVCLN